MSINANFPLNDLLRRRLQTSLAVATLTLSVASTAFLLLFGSRLGLGIASATGTLTRGLTAIFGQFLFFIGILVFTVGVVLTSFIVYLMMAQRTRDFGLIKAVGCPNSLVAGYFMTELLMITLLSCVLGIVCGYLADFAVANLVFSSYALPNFLFAPLVFFAFFIPALVFGLQPILKASRMSPIKALSPVSYYGLIVEDKHKPLSRHGLTWRIATRSLFRRQSVSIRILLLLSIVFVLLTVSVAGGIIASETTTAWVENAVGKNTVAIAPNSMIIQYQHLLSSFTGAKETGNFNYSDPNLTVPETVINQLNTLHSVSLVDARLILAEHAEEVGNFTVDPDTLETYPVGDSRTGDIIVMGINPHTMVGEWSIKGRFLSGTDDLEAVIGDSVSQTMYAPHPNARVLLADPLVEGIRLRNTTFHITGICVDPTNNGQITYVPLEKLLNITGTGGPNLLLVALNPLSDRSTALNEIKNMVQTAGADLVVLDLNPTVSDNVAFLALTWQTVLLLPLFTLASAALSLVGYMMLTVDEQHQEFAILRAVGAKPKIIVNISGIQSMILLVSSFAVGLSIGIILTLIILMANPLVTNLTVFEIAFWLAVALIAMFLLSLYPARRVAKASILRMMT